jgi:hypothetical protein
MQTYIDFMRQELTKAPNNYISINIYYYYYFFVLRQGLSVLLRKASSSRTSCLNLLSVEIIECAQSCSAKYMNI